MAMTQTPTAPAAMLNDYVVEVHNDTGEILRAWQGTTFRKLHVPHRQYKIFNVASLDAAKARGTRIWQQLHPSA
jgi:hypothetical protein